MNLMKLSGGRSQLEAVARKSLSDNDAQWSAELCDYLLVLEPKNQSIRNLKADALEQLAEKLITATGRNYYLSVAQELRKKE
jgi:alkyl sulfatase BDS1-like metallo-beta-lactamase superfamily hydrolase